MMISSGHMIVTCRNYYDPEFKGRINYKATADKVSNIYVMYLLC